MNTVDSAVMPRAGRSGRAERRRITKRGNGGATIGAGVAVRERREHEHAFALARLDEAARDQLVVRGLCGVLRETELFFERAYRRQPATSRECTSGDLALHARDDVRGGRTPARLNDVKPDVGGARHTSSYSLAGRSAKGQSVRSGVGQPAC